MIGFYLISNLRDLCLSNVFSDYQIDCTFFSARNNSDLRNLCWYLILFLSICSWSFCWYLCTELCVCFCVSDVLSQCLLGVFPNREPNLSTEAIFLLYLSARMICSIHCVCQYLSNENSASVWLDWALWRHCLSGELRRCLSLSIS